MEEARINHHFKVTNKESSGAYSASSSEFLPHDSNNTLVLPMTAANAKNHHTFRKDFSDSATYLPIYHRSTDTTDIFFDVVGARTGQCLKDYIETLPKPIWKYDDDKKVKPLDLETHPLKLLRLLGVTLAPIHEKGRYVGDILKLGRVDSDLSRITFDNIHPDGDEATMVAGIRKDIAGFLSVIEALVEAEGLSEPQETNCEALVFFKKLCVDAKFCNFEELKELSYFICYNPISWGFEQRVDFVFKFYSFRELNSNNDKNFRAVFDGVVKLDIAPTDFPMWKHKIPAKTVFEEILTNEQYKESFNTSVSGGLMNYHRACLVHYTEKESVEPPTRLRIIDRQLLSMFPFALPMAWFAFYKNRSDLPTPMANLVTELKKHPGPGFL